MALHYLKMIYEYICHYTVDKTISKIAKGEITREKIDLMKNIEPYRGIICCKFTPYLNIPIVLYLILC